MKRMEAIETIMNAMDNELVVCATGMISRESCYVHDREENFYMIGSIEDAKQKALRPKEK